jgi:hypothetical protein
MAGLGAKLFTAFSKLTAAQVNGYLMDQSIMRFASAAVRDAAFGGAGEPTLAEGMTCYLDDLNVLQTYTGTAWVSLASSAGSVVQTKQTVLNTATSTTSIVPTDVVGFSVTITPTSATSKVLVTVNLNVGFLSADDTSYLLLRGSTAISVGTGGTNAVSAYKRGNLIGDTGMDTVDIVFLDSPATTSATTYKMQYFTRVGTAFVNRRGSDTSFITSSSITVQEIAA